MTFKWFQTTKVILILFALMAMTKCQDFYTGRSNTLAGNKQRFEQFKQTYGKKYKDQPEQLYRQMIMQNNYKQIQETNQAGTKRYTLKANKFADLTAQEFRRSYGSLYVSNKVVQEYSKLQNEKIELEKKDCFCQKGNMDKKRQLESQIKLKKVDFEKKVDEERRRKEFMKDNIENVREDFEENIIDGNNLDEGRLMKQKDAFFEEQKNSFLKENLKIDQDIIHVQRRALVDTSYDCDWTSYTGELRVQGQCGSCYAFAAVQNVESLFAMFTFGFPVEFSVQQIIDCSNNSMSFGCDGGFLEGPFSFLLNYGVTTQYQYPYVSGTSPETVYQCKQQTGPFKIQSYGNIQKGNCTAVKQVLKTKPVSVAIASFRLQFYESGTFTDCDSFLDHAVLLVGFDSLKGCKIKNTWGGDWGEQGYAWIDQTNNCGICEGAVAPNLPNQSNTIPVITLSRANQIQMLSTLSALYK